MRKLARLGLLMAYMPLSAVEIGYTSDYLTDTIYSFDVHTGLYTPLITVPGGIDIVDLQTFGRESLYALSFNDRNLREIDLSDNTVRLVTPTPIGDPSDYVYGVAIADAKTAYVVGFLENKIYSVDLDTGSSSTVLQLPGSPGLTNIAMRSKTLACVVGYMDNNLYEVDVAQNTYRLITPVPVGSPAAPFLEGIALAGDNTAYVMGNMIADLYRVDLTTGAYSLVTPSPIAGGDPINLAIDEGFAYTVNNLGGEIYKIQISDGSYTILSNIPGVNLTGMTLLPPAIIPINPDGPVIFSLPIPLDGLNGNNLSLANYLNAYAPETVVHLFSTLPNNISSALQKASPTRNACVTYSSQLGSLALSRLMHDHARQKNFQHFVRQQPVELTADAVDRVYATKGSCQPATSSTFWAAPFGGYTHIKAQHQTPSFNMKLGGMTIAWDYNGVNRNLFGLGATYLYTNLQEHHNMGHAHLNQGFLSMYGTRNISNMYVDFAFSGGFYRGKSTRRIVFPGVEEVAKSHPQGWQFAPNLELGYYRFDPIQCVSPRFAISPFVLVDWVANWEQKLQEKGAGSLNMGQKGRFCSLLHTEAGIRCHETAKWDGGRVVFREKLAYSYQKAFGTGSLNAFLLGSPGQFTLQTLSSAQNLGIAELSILVLADRPQIPYCDIWYEGQLGAGYQLHQLTLEIGKNF